MKEGMVRNERGIVLSFLALVLLMNLVAINNLLDDDAGFQEMFSKISALSTSGNKVSNLNNSVILYDRENNEPARQRVLPFDFIADAFASTANVADSSMLCARCVIMLISPPHYVRALVPQSGMSGMPRPPDYPLSSVRNILFF